MESSKHIARAYEWLKAAGQLERLTRMTDAEAWSYAKMAELSAVECDYEDGVPVAKPTITADSVYEVYLDLRGDYNKRCDEVALQLDGPVEVEGEGEERVLKIDARSPTVKLACNTTPPETEPRIVCWPVPRSMSEEEIRVFVRQHRYDLAQVYVDLRELVENEATRRSVEASDAAVRIDVALQEAAKGDSP